jgi:HD-GYP domain-containing protein (c-di-GMP phosphodiesterase class II)
MNKKTNVTDLHIGMYVAALDRPWLETPFLFQGFIIENEADLKLLKEQCEYVYVDEERITRQNPKFTFKSGQGFARRFDKSVKHEFKDIKGKHVYRDKVPVEKELNVARAIREDLEDEFKLILQRVGEGKKLDIENASKAISSMVESVLRNPDAFLWLSRLKQSDSYSYQHSIDSAVLSVSMGRHLGFSKGEMNDLAIGTLLLDVGKVKLPEGLLTKPGRLTADELREIHKHVDYSVKIMTETKGISAKAIEMAYSHHERHDGSGYPRGIKGTEIPLFGRIAAVVDCYDAMTSDRAYSKAIAPHQAIRLLYEWRNKDFQEEIVEQFIQCLGVYPTGSLVELSTGQVGVVLSQNRVRHLRPRIILILDEDKIAYEAFPVVDLIKETEDKDGNPLEVDKVLEPHAYGIDPATMYI